MRRMVLAAAIAAVGCSNGAANSGVECGKDTDCKGERICVAGQCVDSNGGGADLANGGSNDLAGAASSDLANAGANDLASANDLANAGANDLANAGANDLASASANDLAGAGANDLASASANDLASASANDLASATASDLAPAIDLAGVDLTPPIAWGQPCSAGSACAAPAGETGRCATAFGTPVCLHTCNGLPDYGSCEAGRGICVPVGGGAKFCFGRCGDQGQLRCGAGTGCALVGRAIYGAANYPVGACVADCTAGGTDACTAPGAICDPVATRCTDASCGAGCPNGTSCQPSGQCNPPSPSPLYGSCSAFNPTCADSLCYGDIFGGTCARFCDTSAAGLQACGAGGTCWTDVNVTPEAPDDAGVVTVPNGSFVAVGGRTVGLCVKGCNTAADCPSYWHCTEINGKRGCLQNQDPAPTITAGSQQPGDPCGAASDCVSNACMMPSSAWRVGACGRVSTSVPCPIGTAADLTTPLLCHKTCTATVGDECPPTQVCNPIKGWCEIAVCHSSDDCSFLATCEPRSARCQTSPPTGTGAVGAACAGDGDCASGHCQPPSGTLWPGGYCSAPCAVRDDFTDTCPSGALCEGVNGTALYVGVEGQCLALCDAGAVARFGACRTGYKCAPFAYDPRFGACVSM